MKNAQAFTLIELMIVLGIAAILATMAAPAFWNMIQNSRTTTQANELVTAINLARSEATKRARNIEVCGSSDQSNCNADWSDGWIVRVENDANEVIRVWDPLPDTANVVDSENGAAMIFSPRGEVDEGRNITLWFDGCAGDRQRRIDVNAAGRPSVTRTACP